MAKDDPGVINDRRFLPRFHCAFPVKKLQGGGHPVHLVCSSPFAKRSPRGPRCADHWPKVCG